MMVSIKVHRSTDARFPVGYVVGYGKNFGDADLIHDRFMDEYKDPDVNVTFTEEDEPAVKKTVKSDAHMRTEP